MINIKTEYEVEMEDGSIKIFQLEDISIPSDVILTINKITDITGAVLDLATTKYEFKFWVGKDIQNSYIVSYDGNERINSELDTENNVLLFFIQGRDKDNNNIFKSEGTLNYIQRDYIKDDRFLDRTFDIFKEYKSPIKYVLMSNNIV